MRYMLMICDDESDGRGPLELVRAPEHVAWIDYLDRRGITLLDGVRLRPSSDATKVQSRSGETLVSDGPFVESKEQIGGFALDRVRPPRRRDRCRGEAPVRCAWSGRSSARLGRMSDAVEPAVAHAPPGQLGSDRRHPDRSDRRLGPRRGVLRKTRSPRRWRPGPAMAFRPYLERGSCRWRETAPPTCCGAEP